MSAPEFSQEVIDEARRQAAIVTRGTTQVVSPEELERKLCQSLTEKRPLRVKLGVDPTAHDLHLGFTLHLRRLQLFLELGHLPVLIIGDATAMVGDPSGRNKARPQLTKDMVEDFSQSYLEQAASVLDVGRCEVRRNGEWLWKLGFEGMLNLVGRATVAQLLEREDFAKRYSEGVPIHLHEFVYPLMQGWDSVVVQSDIELGGQDQLFNLLVGRQMQSSEQMAAQVCMMTPMLVGLDGKRKMSKSFDNFIGVSEAAQSMFGKIMSLPDEAMRTWYELLTDVSLEDFDKDMAAGRHPRELKDQLARNIVERFHDETQAIAASEEFRRVFSQKELPSDIPEFVVPKTEVEADGSIWIAKLLGLCGFAKSNGEAMRLVKGGGVKIDGEALSDPKAQISIVDGAVLRAGKKRFVALKRGD